METVLLHIQEDAHFAAAVKRLLRVRPYLVIQRIRSAAHMAFAFQYYLPSFIVTDWNTAGYDYFSLLPFLRAHANARILIYSEICLPYHVCRAQNSGFLAFVSRQDGLDALVDAFRHAPLSNGQLFVCGKSAESLRTWKQRGGLEYLLTPRLQWILGEIGCGASDVEIANRLQRKSYTIKNQRQAIMDGLGLHTAVELSCLG